MLTKILQDRLVNILEHMNLASSGTQETSSDDSLDYQAINNIMKIFKIKKRKVAAYVVGDSANEDVGMPSLVEVVYKLEHHWSSRVYEKAILISTRYLRGKHGAKLHNLTNIYTELCQEKLHEPDPLVVDQTVIDLNNLAKMKAKKRRGESSSSEEISDEDAKERAITFLMSIGEKRQY